MSFIFLVLIIPTKRSETSDYISILNFCNNDSFLKVITKLMKLLDVKIMLTSFENSAQIIRSYLQIQKPFEFTKIFNNFALEGDEISQQLVLLERVEDCQNWVSSKFIFSATLEKYTFFLLEPISQLLSQSSELQDWRRKEAFRLIGAGVEQASKVSISQDGRCFIDEKRKG